VVVPSRDRASATAVVVVSDGRVRKKVIVRGLLNIMLSGYPHNVFN
jgi:hypothetical protein